MTQKVSSDSWASPRLPPDDGDWGSAEIGLPFPLGQETSLSSWPLISRQDGQCLASLVLPVIEETVDPQHLLVLPGSSGLELSFPPNDLAVGVPTPFSGGVQEYSYQGVSEPPMFGFEAQGSPLNTNPEIATWSPAENSLPDANMLSVALPTVSHALDI
ncbi:hypothetical protein MYCTH_2310457 [Thermothelomyces thermophilus ATCC 42464]|uniref:Uncharacterized protein n=1 Tax=Thermothelomyces thermophilus (strain ATCC 42464 / BCRC 31852 / DSM 1799) TaxID=573729 RepID=G2QLI8_THET4|nr:uncharacterized protein MYCTH_2310457 [Thermothelomyces thermophilus ATCC 42464]AEO60818.1 hypothetical protein MYCTH_2310457 [Thermothelomyces thermophilus ATCC 42464]